MTTIPKKLRVDWRKKSKIRSVYQQGQCGSCYAFGTLTMIEDWHYLLTGKVVKLSQQELVDCVDVDVEENVTVKGCQGNSVASAAKYIHTYGISFAAHYPYQGKEQQCQRDALAQHRRYKKFTNFMRHPPGIISYLNVIKRGPAITGIFISSAFQTWRQPFFPLSECAAQISGGHMIIMIGYRIRELKAASARPIGSYIILKNSWGEEWGHKGFVKFELRVPISNDQKDCGLGTYPTLTPKLTVVKKKNKRKMK